MKNGVDKEFPTPGGGGNGKSWQLTLYDQHRIPHEPITDGTEITVSPRSLNSELMCPICLDMLRSTMTTKECLHRFCQECITTALRSGNKECPTCRKKLISKRSLRPDPNFDALISKLYPDRKEYEAMQERALARLTTHVNTQALQKSIEDGMKFQAQLRKMHRVTNSGSAAASQDEPGERRNKRRRRDGGSRRQTPDRESSVGDMSMSESSATQPSKSRASEVELILKPHPDMERSPTVAAVVKQTRYLKTTANATMDHLATYLSIRIKLDADEAMRNNMEASLEAFDKIKPSPASTVSSEIEKAATTVPVVQGTSATQQPQPTLDPTMAEKESEQYKVFVEQGANPNNIVLLPGHLNLETVVTKFWCVKRPLELLFLVPPTRQGTSNLGPNDENVKPDGSAVAEEGKSTVSTA